jgi:hypothetical protein
MKVYGLFKEYNYSGTELVSLVSLFSSEDKANEAANGKYKEDLSYCDNWYVVELEVED